MEGTSLSEALRQHAEIPPTFIQMVAVGEESGKIDYLLDKMGEAIDGEVEARLSRSISRITSYNVCYTKLLRPLVRQAPEEARLRDRDPLPAATAQPVRSRRRAVV